MRDDEFLGIAEAMTDKLDRNLKGSTLSRDDQIAVISIMMPELLARRLGKVAAIERMRNLADCFESEVLSLRG